MSGKKVILTIVVLAVLGLAYYALSPLFRNVAVDDALPENIVTEDENVSNVPSGFEELSAEEQRDMLEQMEKANETPTPLMDDSMPEVVMMEAAMEKSPPDTIQNEEVESAPEATPVAATFPVMGTAGHPAEGHVRVLETTTGTVVRFEDFKTINGPNLHVYLAKDLRAQDFVDLGSIKGTSGNINYDVPEGVDISEYKYVMHWCVPFGVLFNHVEIN